MRIHNLQKNEQGLVSIVVTVVLMMVITVIVLSFASISRREQRNALDRQLSTQAFYAAESGINDAKKVLETWVTNNDPKLNVTYMSECTGATSFATAASLTLPVQIAGSGAASYTCVFVDPAVSQIETTASDAQQIFPIKLLGGAQVQTLNVYWDDTTGGTDFSGCPAPPVNPISWPATCNAPILRLELVNASDLTTSKVFFVYPHATIRDTLDYSTAGSGAGAGNGATARGACNSGGPKKCLITISGLNGTSYYLRIKGVYKSMALTITPNAPATDKFVGAQTIIDVTGKASDVLRRIQVRLNTNSFSSNVPLYGLVGTDKICKKFSIYGTTATDEGSCSPAGTFPD